MLSQERQKSARQVMTGPVSAMVGMAPFALANAGPGYVVG